MNTKQLVGIFGVCLGMVLHGVDAANAASACWGLSADYCNYVRAAGNWRITCFACATHTDSRPEDCSIEPIDHKTLAPNVFIDLKKEPKSPIQASVGISTARLEEESFTVAGRKFSAAKNNWGFLAEKDVDPAILAMCTSDSVEIPEIGWKHPLEGFCAMFTLGMSKLAECVP